MCTLSQCNKTELLLGTKKYISSTLLHRDNMHILDTIAPSMCTLSHCNKTKTILKC